MSMRPESSSTAVQDATSGKDKLPLAKRSLQTTKPNKKKKKKIPTYTRRQTEIKLLHDEIYRLEKQKEKFKDLEELLTQRQALIQRRFANKAIHDALHVQRLSFVTSMSMISQLFRDVDIGPFDLLTRLGKDPLQRHATLARMRRERLQVAREFMLQIREDIAATETCDRKKFEATNGDMVSTGFEVVLLPGARSVKAIVTALQSFVYNIEISISEAVGDVTVRENDDASPDSPVAQHRLVTNFSNVVQIEANSVAFAEYGPSEQVAGELGLLVSDAVDEDELFPYRPLERVRQDMTAISWHKCESGKPVIALTRW
ncbi:hypothetical protein PHYBOEH_009200 [Phytophthora boehmeriae]|uniref:Uncharacterized protein n=1 Tax=Phytophthora boehmeriae TaxID=109152 RepID=A0A8T1X230_9STRA|nr:hypothetical protein PHYBOEH_009200 [Phytophthora boehmeriae]